MKCDEYVRPVKGEYMLESRAMLKEKTSLRVEVYPKGTVLPLRKCPEKDVPALMGGVTDSDGVGVSLASVPGWIGEGYACSEAECVYDDRTAVYCGCLIRHWGHFLLESITRLWYCLEDFDRDYVLAFVVKEGEPCGLTGNYQRFFDLLGLTNDQIVILNKPTRFRRVIVPERSFQYKKFYSEAYKRTLDEVAKHALEKCSHWEKKAEKRVFLSRSRFQKARDTEIGIDMLDDYFTRNGYGILYPECTDLGELVCRLRNAQVCASASGTVAHNFIFCKDGQETIIIEREPIVNDAQMSIERIRHLQTTYIDGHVAVYPPFPGRGPFFFCFTSCFRRFTQEKGYVFPGEEYLNDETINRNLRQYLEIYRNNNGEALAYHPIHDRFAPCIVEAYADAEREMYAFLHKGF